MMPGPPDVLNTDTDFGMNLPVESALYAQAALANNAPLGRSSRGWLLSATDRDELDNLNFGSPPEAGDSQNQGASASTARKSDSQQNVSGQAVANPPASADLPQRSSLPAQSREQQVEPVPRASLDGVSVRNSSVLGASVTSLPGSFRGDPRQPSPPPEAQNSASSPPDSATSRGSWLGGAMRRLFSSSGRSQPSVNVLVEGDTDLGASGDGRAIRRSQQGRTPKGVCSGLDFEPRQAERHAATPIPYAQQRIFYFLAIIPWREVNAWTNLDMVTANAETVIRTRRELIRAINSFIDNIRRDNIIGLEEPFRVVLDENRGQESITPLRWAIVMRGNATWGSPLWWALNRLVTCIYEKIQLESVARTASVLNTPTGDSNNSHNRNNIEEGRRLWNMLERDVRNERYVRNTRNEIERHIDPDEVNSIIVIISSLGIGSAIDSAVVTDYIINILKRKDTDRTTFLPDQGFDINHLLWEIDFIDDYGKHVKLTLVEWLQKRIMIFNDLENPLGGNRLYTELKAIINEIIRNHEAKNFVGKFWAKARGNL